jgi:hypothetical protein
MTARWAFIKDAWKRWAFYNMLGWPLYELGKSPSNASGLMLTSKLSLGLAKGLIISICPPSIIWYIAGELEFQKRERD